MNEEKGMTVLITGGSGLIGRYLTSALLSEGFNVRHLSRKGNQFGKVRVFRWDPEKGILDPMVFEGVDYIVHLAGANIGEKRWTRDRKAEILNSRVESAKLIYRVIADNNIQIKAFISASAVGYYGSVSSGNIFTENDSPADDFLGNVCRKWEEAADLFSHSGIRVVKIRTGVVMEKSDSALSRFLATARFGLFPVLGGGNQFLPWIHPEDLSGIYLKAINDESMSGAYNAVSPHHVNQKDFMRTLAEVLKRSYFAPPVPSVLLKIIMGEMASIATKGSRIDPEKIINSGYKFKFSTLESALRNILAS